MWIITLHAIFSFLFLILSRYLDLRYSFKGYPISVLGLSWLSAGTTSLLTVSSNDVSRNIRKMSWHFQFLKSRSEFLLDDLQPKSLEHRLNTIQPIIGEKKEGNISYLYTYWYCSESDNHLRRKKFHILCAIYQRKITNFKARLHSNKIILCIGSY